MRVLNRVLCKENVILRHILYTEHNLSSMYFYFFALQKITDKT